ncbi:hypothetical protein BDW67DRAFT_169226 [Aspergillus spinulosporus]
MLACFLVCPAASADWPTGLASRPGFGFDFVLARTCRELYSKGRIFIIPPSSIGNRSALCIGALILRTLLMCREIGRTGSSWLPPSLHMHSPVMLANEGQNTPQLGIYRDLLWSIQTMTDYGCSLTRVCRCESEVTLGQASHSNSPVF